ncbi:MAG: HAD family hydrolase [Synergistaceae bacterium]|nr:HAD family hydrolase [Synergistaceae bacterium]
MSGRLSGSGRAFAALFDFDMTLMDTSCIITECTNLLADKFALRRVTHAEMKSLIGLTIEDEWIKLWGDFKQEWLDYYRSHFRSIERSGFREFPDTRSAVENLRENGVKTGIVTNRSFARPVAEQCGVSGLFDVIIGRDDVDNPKPHPKPLLAALSRIGVETGRAYYVGDTDIDMKTANAAGVIGIGVATGNFTTDELIAAGASYARGDLTGVADTILEIIAHS